MKVGDLVRNAYNNHIGIVISMCLPAAMYSVYIDGINVLLHESDLEVIYGG